MALKKCTLPTGEIRWEVRIRKNGKGSTAIRRRFEKRSDAEAYLGELKDQAKRNRMQGLGVQNSEPSTLQAESEFWLRTRGIEFSPGYRKRVREILGELLPKYGTLDPTGFHPGRLTEIQGELAKKGVTPATINRAVNVVTAILSHAATCRRIPYNPSSGFRRLKEYRDDIQFWEEHEATGFLGWAAEQYPSGTPERQIYLVYLVALNTGLRAGEIWGLRVGDLVRNGTMFHIKGQFDRVDKAFGLCKDKEQRLVPCNAELRREVEAWIAYRGMKAHEPLFQLTPGRNVNHDGFRKRHFDKDMRRSGFRSIRFHDLRHTAATLMIAKGLDLPTVQAILGHSTITTTMRYVHVLGHSIERAAAMFTIAPTPKPDVAPPLRLVK